MQVTMGSFGLGMRRKGRGSDIASTSSFLAQRRIETDYGIDSILGQDFWVRVG